MKHLYPFRKKSATKSFLALLFIFSQQLIQAQLVFNNNRVESGTNRSVGCVYRFGNVCSGVDALIRIDSLINGASILEIDQANAGFVDAFQPRIQSGLNGTSYAVFTISFVLQNTNTLTTVNTVSATNLDLDGNNNLKEFCEFNLGGGTATYMNASPQIRVQGVNNKFYAQNIGGIEYAGIDTSADAVMFKVRRDNISSFTVRLGAIVTNGGSAARQYSVYMKEFQITNPVSLPLTLLNFDAYLKKDKAELNWSTTEHKNFSHFILQRSEDGKNYRDVMTLLTDEAVTTNIKNYRYSDDVSNINSQTVYYRLKMVDIDAKYQYSPIRMIRLSASTMVQVQTFPNPVTNELRVMIPNNWQGKMIAYEIYTNAGLLVNRIQNTCAAQIQQINVQSLSTGNYIIRVMNGSEKSVSKFIKQ
jgi:hypothetical protein